MAEPTITDSIVRLTWDPDGAALILVDYADALWSPIVINGSQVVDVENLVRSNTSVAFPMGNDKTQIEFEKCNLTSTIYTSFAVNLDGIVNLPRTGSDLLIELENGRKWRAKHCAIESWDVAQPEQFERTTSQMVRITGGKLITDAGDYNPTLTWENLVNRWEDIN